MVGRVSRAVKKTSPGQLAWCTGHQSQRQACVKHPTAFTHLPTHTHALENTHTLTHRTHTHSFRHALTLGHILHQHHRAVVVHLDGRRIRGGYEGHLPSELGCILVDFEHLHTNPTFTGIYRHLQA